MRKTMSSSIPELISYEGEGVALNYDVEEISVQEHFGEEEGQETTAWKYYTTRLKHPLTYGRIVDAIVRDAYPQDVMQAIINNHLLDPDDEENKKEFDEMQAWRKHAKEVAKEVINQSK